MSGAIVQKIDNFPTVRPTTRFPSVTLALRDDSLLRDTSEFYLGFHSGNRRCSRIHARRGRDHRHAPIAKWSKEDGRKNEGRREEDGIGLNREESRNQQPADHSERRRSLSS